MTRMPRPSDLEKGLEPRYRYKTEQDHAKSVRIFQTSQRRLLRPGPSIAAPVESEHTV